MDIRNRISAMVLATGAAAAVTLPVAATVSLEQASLERLTELADVAVHGTIERIESFTENDRIFTRIEVVTTEVLKGQTASRVTLRMYGGSYGDKRTVVVGGPCMSVGEEVVLFLRANGPGTYDVVNLAEGKFRVVRPAGNPAGVDRDLSGIHYLDPGAGGAMPATLEELKAAIRGAATGVGR